MILKQQINILEWFLKDQDWRNDAENSDLHYRNKLHFKIYSNRKQIFEIVKNISIYNFDQINAALVSCILKIFKNLPQTFEH